MLHISKFISEIIAERTGSIKFYSELLRDETALLVKAGPLIEPLFKFHDPEYDKYDFWSEEAHKHRCVRVSASYTSITVSLMLKVDDEFGDATEFVEHFEDMLIAGDVDFVAQNKDGFEESGKSRKLSYRIDSNTPGKSAWTLHVAVDGNRSEKCVIVEIPTGEMSEPAPIMKRKLMCPGDPEYSTYVQKEQDSEAIEIQVAEQSTIAAANEADSEGNTAPHVGIGEGNTEGVDEGAVLHNHSSVNGDADTDAADASTRSGHDDIERTKRMLDDDIPF